MASPYEVLGVPHSATAAQIRAAYRRAALASHPDKNPGDPSAEAQFLRVSSAYDVLRDEAKRAAYDRGGCASTSTAVDFGDPDLFRARARARDQFNMSFGDQLARQWRPGMVVSGKLWQNGKMITIVIHADGSTEEREEAPSIIQVVLTPLSWIGLNIGGSSTTASSAASTSASDGGSGAAQHSVNVELSCVVM